MRMFAGTILVCLLAMGGGSFAQGQEVNFSGTWILNMEKSRLEHMEDDFTFGSISDEFIADEVFKGLPQDHHNIWVFGREVTR